MPNKTHESELVTLYTKQNIDLLKWDNYTDGKGFKQLFGAIIAGKSADFIANAAVEMGLIAVENQLIPYTIGDRKLPASTTYLVSIVSQYIRYSNLEVQHAAGYSKASKWLVDVFSKLAEKLLIALRADQNIMVNNWLVSTNLYAALPLDKIEAIKAALLAKYPNHAIVFRSITEGVNDALSHALLQQNFVPIASRQVYLLDPKTEEYKKKRPYQQDSKAWQKETTLHWDLLPLQQHEVPLVRHFYHKLYLEKYSIFNPDYSDAFIWNAHNSGLMHFQCLRDEDKLVAVQGISIRNNVATTPFIGYDYAQPVSRGLYRFMNVKLTQTAAENAALLNMSSGAAPFKKQRGGVGAYEYNYVFAAHCGLLQRNFWRLMHVLSERFFKQALTQFDAK